MKKTDNYGYTQNVYELAQERLDVIFREFDTICVSFREEKIVECC